MKRIILIASLLLSISALLAQDAERFRVVWYNVENYFDAQDDSLKLDEEYLPGGMRGWSVTKYRKKQANIAKVITAVSGWENAAVIGLCEVENRYCMVGLAEYSPLKSLGYEIVHHESPDFRGIDVGMLYDPLQFKPLYDEAIPVNLETGKPTRDILYVKGLAHRTDTVHFFVCHFSSRWGGTLESEPRRVFTAAIVRSRVDSILAVNDKANIVIMGDFNDAPSDKSMSETLAARPLTAMPDASKLYNMMIHFEENNIGSHKYQQEWSCLDQIVVSENLLDKASNIRTSQEDTHIFSPDFLLEKDVKFLGEKPFRTYIGFKYHEGYSDHLPLYLDLWIKK